MSSTFSTQNRQTFLRRKYCFFPVAMALSPPVGRCEAAIGRPPLCICHDDSPCCSFRRYFCSGCAGRAGCRGVPVTARLDRDPGIGGQLKELPWPELSGFGRLARCSFLALLLPLLDALHLLVDADRHELDHQIGDAQPALEFLDRRRPCGKLQQHVLALRCTFRHDKPVLRTPHFSVLSSVPPDWVITFFNCSINGSISSSVASGRTMNNSS